MGLFTKKTKTSFKRNKAGKVVRVERSEEKPRFSFKKKSKTPVYDELEKQYYEKHPEETTRYKAKKAGSRLLNNFDTWADNYVKNTKKQTKKPKQRNPYSSYDFTNNFNPIGDMFDTGMHAPKKKKKNRGFDPFDNWGFY